VEEVKKRFIEDEVFKRCLDGLKRELMGIYLKEGCGVSEASILK